MPTNTHMCMCVCVHTDRPDVWCQLSLQSISFTFYTFRFTEYYLVIYYYYYLLFSKTRQHLRYNLLFSLLQDVNISFFLSFFLPRFFSLESATL